MKKILRLALCPDGVRLPACPGFAYWAVAPPSAGPFGPQPLLLLTRGAQPK
ncbi:putative agnoprotein [California sea lion polyomavirus 1]|uniref:Putative agnoprotein n=1 Tax=California sea lion polyomavirus 1 TaxID=715223 RepID=D3IZT0_9POLY|nr:putative agnoprotein [California sea lion polyomavirus 1]ADC34414.1 putative agnoprotein [California sea lion polyomavirus 1]ADK22088.1 putative agnoprotein [California sea lion polyomavirus 1]ADK22091.1 putative agnoprotein [California sea lion polyomavirus 1]ADK22094.1 putative agnoprotein [California sea lion polyomavirus 1]